MLVLNRLAVVLPERQNLDVGPRRQPEAWRNQVLPPGIRSRVSIEAASDFGWLPWVTEDGESIGINRFGASAPGDRLFQKFGFTSERVADAVRRVLAGRPA